MYRGLTSFVVALVTFTLAAVAPHAANAGWPKDPNVNLPVCTAVGDQWEPQPVSDGSGGAIIAWADLRNAGYDIYAHHVLASGVVDPAWPSDGIAVCAASGTQGSPQLLADGTGGAIITWVDERSGGNNQDVYAQHVLASGAVDPAWPTDGRAVCTAVDWQLGPRVVADGVGGAIITWQDRRTGGSWFDIYAQRVLASGVVDPVWPLDGRAICTATNTQIIPQIVSDGAGGAIITWQDSRSGGSSDIYAQHVLASGGVDSAWPVDGLAVCTASGLQESAKLVADASGGAHITWHDQRSGGFDVYAQHVLGSGAVNAVWPTDGLRVCTNNSTQRLPQIVSDGSGGVLITSEDNRNGASNIYAHHILPSGGLDGDWTFDGVAVAVGSFAKLRPQIVSDGSGGAIIAWEDFRTTLPGIYAQRLLASGELDPAWLFSGLAVSTAPGTQSSCQIVGDGAGGSIVAWSDSRLGVADIYAQAVDKTGRLGLGTPLISSALDVPNDEGGKVKLSWHASDFDFDPDPLVENYWVYRSVPPNAVRWGGVDAQSLSLGRQGWLGPLSKYVSTTNATSTSSAAETIFWEYVQEEDAFHFLDAYSALVETTGDSLGPDLLNLTTEFMVVAMSADSTLYWLSPPVSGYSVDNLSPPSPGALRAQVVDDDVRLTWDPDIAPDVVRYRVYRGAVGDFGPSEANLLATVETPEFTAVAAGEPVFKVAAVDRNGNEGEPATLVLGVDLGPTAATSLVSLGRPAPNPVMAQARIGFAIARAGQVDLQVFDAGGRLIRTLGHGARVAGQHFVDWDLRSDSGREVGPGLYFVKLQAHGKSLSHRLTVLR